ncbi:segregation and condensation protein A [Synechococcus sp. M16CYN]|uniref:segregation and condensation protein A n=1 Tax=Synechococcus sp. M16CYN TaxID=3103139 RepID=UPI00324B3340
MHQVIPEETTGSGTPLAIRLLQSAVECGSLDPWGVNVIAVLDGFLDQLRQRLEMSRQITTAVTRQGGSYERDLAESSQAFLAASILLELKAQSLEASLLSSAPEVDEYCEVDPDNQRGLNPCFELPKRPELYLQRRPVAPLPLRRIVALGALALVEQLEAIAKRRLESREFEIRPRQSHRRSSANNAVAQVADLAHREKLPETTEALGVFLAGWEDALDWVDFEQLVRHWGHVAAADLNRDRVGVFRALLFLSSQGKVELDQKVWLHGPLQFKRTPASGIPTRLPIGCLRLPDPVSTAATTITRK